MAIDLRTKRVNLPVIPSPCVIRKRIDELREEAAKLDILLRIATELEEASAPNSQVGEGGQE